MMKSINEKNSRFYVWSWLSQHLNRTSWLFIVVCHMLTFFILMKMYAACSDVQLLTSFFTYVAYLLKKEVEFVGKWKWCM